MPAAEQFSRPVSAAEAAACFAPLADRPKLALAVSGGGDSVALMRLAAAWREALGRGPELHVFTVDHGLRAGSAAEAAKVATWAGELGLGCTVLNWRGAAVVSNIQAAAREARYRLLAEACWSRGIEVLASAHHLDDQAETVLMRLARGSGFYGLAGIGATARIFGLEVVRPLLAIPKRRLVATLAAERAAFVEDPSNRDFRFERARLRAMMPELTASGLTAERIAALAEEMAAARRVVDAALARLSGEAVEMAPGGYCRIDRVALRRGELQIAERLLARVLMAVGGSLYPPRRERLPRLFADLVEGRAKARTLGGCRIERRGDQVTVWREQGRAGLPQRVVGAGQTVLWDRRFRASAPAAGSALTVRALEREGWRAVRQAGADGGLGAEIGEVLPSFWRGEQLIAVPHLARWAEKGCAPGARWVREIAQPPAKI